MTRGPDSGDKAPELNLPTDRQGIISLKDFKGKAIVVYFYPKDDTSGCTREAIAFSALLPQFAAAGAVVIGVSKDSLAKHAKFRDKHGLKVILAADEGGEALARYGVWVEKSMYGRKYMGIERATFLIDGKGVIRQVWRKVKVPGHAEQVLQAVKAL
ncbi:MAG: peroxiredoxin [Pseudomonadota bacterium]